MPGHRRSRPRRPSRPARRAAAVAGLVGCLVLATLTAPAPALADGTCALTWTGGNGLWTDAARWAPARVPAPDDAVCIAAAADGTAPVVRVPASTDVAGLTLTGATLALAPEVAFGVSQLAASRARIAGGTLRGAFGITALTDSRLDGVQLLTDGILRLAGRITVSGGSRIVQNPAGGSDLRAGVQVVDADGNPGNHLQFSRFPLYLTGPAFVGVRLALVDALLLAQGDVTLAALDNLDADGVLRPVAGGRTLQLGTGSTGTLHLPRTITRVGRGVTLDGGTVVTPTGADALAGLATIDGTVSTQRPVYLDGPLTVRGRFSSSSTLSSPGVDVRAGASFAAHQVDGPLTSAGSLGLAGSRVGRLTLLPGSDTTVDLASPTTVLGRATLAGSVLAGLPRGPRSAAGTTLVMLTATGGVTGAFDAATTDRPDRAGVRLGYRPTFVTATITPASG